MLELLQQLIASFFPPLLFTYWFFATASVIVTILPIPVPQAFKWVAVAVLLLSVLFAIPSAL
jgi:hypothetical protein